MANEKEREYNRDDAKAAVESIEEALRIADTSVVHRCQRCSKELMADEYARSQRFFQRNYCNHCFDHTATTRRNFESEVEDQKKIRVCDGTLVQSDGEKRIAEWLAAHNIPYHYDARLRIIEGFQIRPDFYLPELDVFIEYWGMDTPHYKAGMHLKQELYMQVGKKLISVYAKEKDRIGEILAEKLLPDRPTNSTGVTSTSEGLQKNNKRGPVGTVIVPGSRTKDSAPLCPACGKVMKARVATRGPKSGESFWGCSQYPICRAIREMM